VLEPGFLLMFQQCEHILPDASRCTRVLNMRLSKLQRKGLQMRLCAGGVWGGGGQGCFLAWRAAQQLAAQGREAQRRDKGQQLARGRAAAQQPAAAVAAVAPPQLSPMASPVTSPPSEMGRVAKRQRGEAKSGSGLVMLLCWGVASSTAEMSELAS
jgi:hypothetical protein